LLADSLMAVQEAETYKVTYDMDMGFELTAVPMLAKWNYL
jgi:hypothetical protein